MEIAQHDELILLAILDRVRKGETVEERALVAQRLYAFGATELAFTLAAQLVELGHRALDERTICLCLFSNRLRVGAVMVLVTSEERMVVDFDVERGRLMNFDDFGPGSVVFQREV